VHEDQGAVSPGPLAGFSCLNADYQCLQSVPGRRGTGAIGYADTDRLANLHQANGNANTKSRGFPDTDGPARIWP